MKTSDSLSGQNMNGRIASEGSSPSHSTLSVKEGTKLWNKLRELDRKISLLPQFRYFKNYFNTCTVKFKNEFLKLDQQRKDIINKLKYNDR